MASSDLWAGAHISEDLRRHLAGAILRNQSLIEALAGRLARGLKSELSGATSVTQEAEQRIRAALDALTSTNADDLLQGLAEVAREAQDRVLVGLLDRMGLSRTVEAGIQLQRPNELAARLFTEQRTVGLLSGKPAQFSLSQHLHDFNRMSKEAFTGELRRVIHDGTSAVKAATQLLAHDAITPVSNRYVEEIRQRMRLLSGNLSPETRQELRELLGEYRKYAKGLTRAGEAGFQHLGMRADTMHLIERLEKATTVEAVEAAVDRWMVQKQVYHAKVVARTELNRGYTEAMRETARKNPAVVGWEVKLSGSHPRPDICDDLAGKYYFDGREGGKQGSPDMALPPWHPSCLCNSRPILDTGYFRKRAEELRAARAEQGSSPAAAAATGQGAAPPALDAHTKERIAAKVTKGDLTRHLAEKTGLPRERFKNLPKARLSELLGMEAEEVKGALGLPTNPDSWKQVGSRLGSNEGGTFEAPGGKRWYVKFYGDPDQARGEVVAARVYRELGVETLEPQLVTMRGRTGVATAWREGLQRLTAEQLLEHREDLAKIYQASVVTKNWDVVGLDLDNIVLSPSGRLAVVDTGGAFRFRAQGLAKTFGPDIDEVRTLRDAAVNREGGRVFGELFRRDVWLEAQGAQPVLGLKKSGVEAMFREAGFGEGDVKELTGSLWARRQALIDRYDLQGKLTYPGFGKHLEEFKKWERGIFETAQEATNTTPILVNRFESYVAQRFGPEGQTALKRWFNEWSGSSRTTPAAGLVKDWTHERMGVRPGYHNGEVGAGARRVASEHASRVERASRLSKTKLFELLDAEYEFHQYYLRRVHGWDEFEVVREMDSRELRATVSRGWWEAGSATCTAHPRGVFVNTEAISARVRVEDILKTWRQGPRYMPFYDTTEYHGTWQLPDAGHANGRREHEYIAIGRKRPATVIKRNGRYL